MKHEQFPVDIEEWLTDEPDRTPADAIQPITQRLSARGMRSAESERFLWAHVASLVSQGEAVLDHTGIDLARYDLSAMSDGDSGALSSRFAPPSAQRAPSLAHFLGKLVKKAKGLVKAGVDLAKKGAAARGELGLKPLLDKLKRLIPPLLRRAITTRPRLVVHGS